VDRPGAGRAAKRLREPAPVLPRGHHLKEHGELVLEQRLLAGEGGLGAQPAAHLPQSLRVALAPRQPRLSQAPADGLACYGDT
jgi:hypothetical protein